MWLSGRDPYFVTHDGAITPCLRSFGASHIDTEDSRCKPRLVTVLGKGSYVKVVDRVGKLGKKMVVIGAAGIRKDKAQVHSLDINNLAAIRAPDDSSDPDEDGEECQNWADHVDESGVGPTGLSAPCCSLSGTRHQSEGDLTEPTVCVGSVVGDHRLTHKPTDPTCDACLRGKMNLSKYAGALGRP